VPAELVIAAAAEVRGGSVLSSPTREVKGINRAEEAGERA
jgi:hypothetical protein